MHFVCPPVDGAPDDSVHDCGDGYAAYPGGCSCVPWGVPRDAALPLVYWILLNSVAAYLLMNWGNQFAEPSSVLGYTALQPLTSSLLVVAINALTDRFGLADPGWNLLGGVGIVGGLYLLVFDARRALRRAAGAAAVAGGGGGRGGGLAAEQQRERKVVDPEADLEERLLAASGPGGGSE